MTEVSREYRILAGLAYLLWPVSLLLVLTAYKRDRFLRYHGYQALYFGLCCTVFHLVVGGFLQIIPVFGILIYKALVMAWLLFLLLLLYRTFQGELFRVPLIYDLAQGVME
ncbi:MAG TPA: DUF4870 domain-containing protein [Bacillota bacterium]|mgnify:FL=1|nr:DUF4870 domain-containing protein [Bacillota bacterium]